MEVTQIAEIAGTSRQTVYAKTRPPEEVYRTETMARALQLVDVKAPQKSDDVITDVVQKKKRKDSLVRPTTIDNGASSQSEISEMLNSVLRWYKMPKVQSDEECGERLELFFNSIMQAGELPSVEKMALALGVTRESVRNWENGIKCSAVRTDMIRRAKEILAAMDAELVSRNKIPQVTYIFRAKNFFGMKDQTDVIVTPNNPLGEAQSADDIAARYAELPDE